MNPTPTLDLTLALTLHTDATQVTAGDGISPAAASKVRVHYEGRLLDGTVFDSSYKRGAPAARDCVLAAPQAGRLAGRQAQITAGAHAWQGS